MYLCSKTVFKDCVQTPDAVFQTSVSLHDLPEYVLRRKKCTKKLERSYPISKNMAWVKNVLLFILCTVCLNIVLGVDSLTCERTINPTSVVWCESVLWYTSWLQVPLIFLVSKSRICKEERTCFFTIFYLLSSKCGTLICMLSFMEKIRI